MIKLLARIYVDNSARLSISELKKAELSIETAMRLQFGFEAKAEVYGQPMTCAEEGDLVAKKGPRAWRTYP